MFSGSDTMRLPETLTAPGFATGRRDLWLLMFLHACAYWVLAGANLPLAHDTMINFQIFSTVYSGYMIDGQFPLWLPYTAHGITADYGYAFTFTPAFYAATFIGRLFSASDSLLMFRLGLYLEEALLVYGLYLLSTLFHRQRITPIILAFTGVLSVSWEVQIHWNFQLIYLLPLLLYHLTRWLRGNGLEYAAYAAVLLTLGGIFYAQIFIAATLSVFVCLYLLLMRPPPETLLQSGLNPWAGWAIVVCAFFVAVLNIEFARHVIDGMQSFTSQRNTDGSVALDIFLTYGGYLAPEKFMEFLYGAPERFAFIAYSGLFTVLFVAYGLIRHRPRSLALFLLLALFVLLFSLGRPAGVAELAYHVFPGMDKFRHIGFVTPVAKILFIIASGFGIDHYLANRESGAANAAILGALCISLGIVFLGLDVLNDWHYAYPVDTNLAVPFGFHYLQWAALVLFVGLSFLLPRHGATLLVVCALLEIAGYRFVLESRAPAMTSPWPEHWQALRHAYDVAPLTYHAVRERESSPAVQARFPVIDVWGVHHSFGYTAARLDPCFPVHRADLSGTAFDSLVRTRLALAPGVSSHDYFTIGTLEKDPGLMAAIGCQRAKLYFASGAVPVESDADAARLVRTSASLYEIPVIQRPCGAECTVIPATPSGSHGGSITVRHFSANLLEADVDVANARGSYLVYLDDVHPGWQADVDGVSTPVYPANLAFKAIEVPQGPHRITFRFTGGSAWSMVTIWTNYILTVLFIIGVLLWQAVRAAAFMHARLTGKNRAEAVPQTAPESPEQGAAS